MTSCSPHPSRPRILLAAATAAMLILVGCAGPLASLDPTTADDVGDELVQRADELEAAYVPPLSGEVPTSPDIAEAFADDMAGLRKLGESVKSARGDDSAE